MLLLFTLQQFYILYILLTSDKIISPRTLSASRRRRHHHQMCIVCATSMFMLEQLFMAYTHIIAYNIFILIIIIINSHIQLKRVRIQKNIVKASRNYSKHEKKKEIKSLNPTKFIAKMKTNTHI